jgi:hypothetical protein
VSEPSSTKKTAKERLNSVNKIAKNFLCLATVAAISFICSAGFAGPMVDFGGTFSSNSLSTSSESTNSQNFYNLSVMFNIDTKVHYNLGWAVFGISESSKVGATETSYSSFDMGPAFRWNIDKNGIFSITIVYGYLAKGKYSVGTTSQDWEGSSLLLQFGMQAPVREDKFYVGLTLNSYTGTYTDKIVSNVKSSVSATKTSVFPMVSLTWRM